jgi:hypothetical protein
VAIDHALSAGDAMSHGTDDVDVDELTRVFALIAPDRFSRLQGTQLIQADPTQNTADGGWRDAGLSSTTVCGIGRRSRFGRDERSCNPANRSRR